MIRIVLQNILLFLLPTFAYIGYRMLIARSPGALRRAIDEAPYGWLTLIGLACVGIFIAMFATTEGGKPGQIYIPPVVKDGKLIPGHYVSDEPSSRPGSLPGGTVGSDPLGTASGASDKRTN